MSAVLKQIRFFEGRRHQLTRHKTPRKGLSPQEIYGRKLLSRQNRAEEIETNEALQSYINWIKQIQKKLRLSDASFASRLGIKVQMLKLWYRPSGHLPSERVFKRLLVLERESRIQTVVIKANFGIRHRR